MQSTLTQRIRSFGGPAHGVRHAADGSPRRPWRRSWPGRPWPRRRCSTARSPATSPTRPAARCRAPRSWPSTPAPACRGPRRPMSEAAFIFSDLIPGVYDVTFEQNGFKKLAQRGVRVDTNTVRRVDARLEVSAVTETVEVVSARRRPADRSRRHGHDPDLPAGHQPAAHRQPRTQLPEPDAGRAGRVDRPHGERAGRGQLAWPAARSARSRSRPTASPAGTT